MNRPASGEHTGYIGEINKYRKKKSKAFDESSADIAATTPATEINQNASTRQDIYQLGMLILDLIQLVYEHPEPQEIVEDMRSRDFCDQSCCLCCSNKGSEQPPRHRISTGPTSHMVRAQATVKRVVYDQAILQLQKHLLPIK